MIETIIVIVCVVISILAIMIIRAYFLKKQNEMMESYMEYMQHYYDMMDKKVDATRKYRHDLAKHIQTLEYLMEKNNGSTQMKEYIEGMKNEYQIVNEKVYCTDPIVNAIVLVKQQKCNEEHIPFNIDMEQVIETEIDKVDFVSVLHNLLDNAIEENEKINDESKRGIWIQIKNEENRVIVNVKNAIDEGKQIDFKTSKKNKEEHGIGLHIIDEIVKKYKGTKQYTVDENRFEAVITI